jgi:hypothetical protein
LEFCKTIDQAVELLHRIPSHMSYNVMLMNRSGEHRLVQVAPDYPLTITDLSASTNHQGIVDWPEHAAFTKTIERELYLLDMLAQGGRTAEQIAKEFLKAPLFNRKYRLGFGTLYTAVYRPKEGALELLWPGIKLRQTFDEFQEGVTSISYSESIDISTTNAIPASQLQEDYNGAVEAYWLEYGRSWTNHEHAVTADYIRNADGKSISGISLRIEELLAQMESVATGDGTYKAKLPEVWKRVETKK